MEKELISMTDFVLETYEKYRSQSMNGQIGQTAARHRALEEIHKYANFLKRKLELWMFIPCVDGVPIEKPEKYQEWLICGKDQVEEGKQNSTYWECEQYNEALSKVLFKGFELIEHDKMIPKQKSIAYEEILHVFWKNELIKGWYLSKGLKTIEDLIPYNLKLTKQALKLIQL